MVLESCAPPTVAYTARRNPPKTQHRRDNPGHGKTGSKLTMSHACRGSRRCWFFRTLVCAPKEVKARLHTNQDWRPGVAANEENGGVSGGFQKIQAEACVCWRPASTLVETSGGPYGSLGEWSTRPCLQRPVTPRGVTDPAKGSGGRACPVLLSNLTHTTVGGGRTHARCGRPGKTVRRRAEGPAGRRHRRRSVPTGARRPTSPTTAGRPPRTDRPGSGGGGRVPRRDDR